jgi:hypothetical protein
MLVNFMDISSILLPFGVIYVHLVYFVVILVSFSRFGMLHQEKSGNPVPDSISNIATGIRNRQGRIL